MSEILFHEIGPPQICENEGGHCSPTLIINGEDVTSRIDEIVEGDLSDAIYQCEVKLRKISKQ